MTGTTRSSSPSGATGDGAVDRDATIESLLLTGLDCYFGGDYERAVHAWTRVLFLDRSHPRARAYIERARAVQAERQRRADALVQGGLAAFDRGDAGRARELLASAVSQGGADDIALALLQRLDRVGEGRLTPGPAGPNPTAGAGFPEPGPPAGRRRSRVNRTLLVSTLALLVVAVSLVLGWERIDRWRAGSDAPVTAPLPASEPEPLPLPRASELALRRVQALVARGHLHEALGALAYVPLTDPRRAEADRLRAEIERTLIQASEAGPVGPAGSSPQPSGRRR